MTTRRHFFKSGAAAAALSRPARGAPAPTMRPGVTDTGDQDRPDHAL